MFEFNPHPPLSAVPVVLFCSALILELLSFKFVSTDLRKCARIVVTLALFITPVTYLSGYWGASSARTELAAAKLDNTHGSRSALTEEQLDNYIETHRATGRLLLMSLFPLGLFAILSWFKEQLNTNNAPLIVDSLFRLFLIITVLSTMYTSYLGGQLVFTYGAGVSGTKQAEIK